ncbi:Protein aubergine [Orchesella cincta]|uniref:Protein aubergine n=1 Tax=Orchesella cincta TaxID=48709 RepID=A0A1D2M4W7_ORCCI|nr:Protein aubergine [Orchesella cincta]
MPLHRISSDRPNDYAKGVDDVMISTRTACSFSLSSFLNRPTTLPSQCFVARNAQNDKGLMSICTKLVVQMNAKLGGEPWTVLIPLKVKTDGCRIRCVSLRKRKGSSVGAMVATTSASYAKYFSTVSHHSSRDELSDRLRAAIL